jgi:hypothetical protein
MGTPAFAQPYKVKEPIAPASLSMLSPSKSFLPSAHLRFSRLKEQCTPNAPVRSVVFLPQWRAENLPFFCKIEHQWGKKMIVPMKFRLGSVEYVDALEGKTP